MNRFIQVILKNDAAELKKMVHPDIIEGREIGKEDARKFLEQFRSRVDGLDSFRIDGRFTSEDAETDRFQTTIFFRCSALSSEFSAPARLQMTLLWVKEQKRWWLERPLSIYYSVTSTARYPTAEQEEAASRFQTALDVMDRLGSADTEDFLLADIRFQGAGIGDYKDLERLHRSEKGPNGVDPNGRGVKVLLKGAGHSEGGFLQIYHGDFPGRGEDHRNPAPWDIYRDYVEAAIKYGQLQEKRGNLKTADGVYRRLLSLGRQLVDEPGGVHFLMWGTTFQKMAATELVRLAKAGSSQDQAKAQTLLQLYSRRSDLLETAIACLDDMADYKSLKAAILATERVGDLRFRPWGINTLAIFALKGAPASPQVMEKVGGMVLVTNIDMQKIAALALEKPASEQSASVKAFIGEQMNWVRTHKVYGEVRSGTDPVRSKRDQR